MGQTMWFMAWVSLVHLHRTSIQVPLFQRRLCLQNLFSKLDEYKTRITESKKRQLPVKFQNLKNVICEENIFLFF